MSGRRIQYCLESREALNCHPRRYDTAQGHACTQTHPHGHGHCEGNGKGSLTRGPDLSRTWLGGRSGERKVLSWRGDHELACGAALPSGSAFTAGGGRGNGLGHGLARRVGEGLSRRRAMLVGRA